MKIAEALATKQTFSFEIFPPKGDFSVDEASKVASELASCNPDFISITFSAGGSGNSGNTAAIAARIQQENPHVMAMAHLTCMGSTLSEVDAYIDRLQTDGVENVLALRGDPIPGREPKDFSYASDLIAHLKEQDPDLCVGAACYPEGHVACEDFSLSMEHLKAKQDAGADFFVSQLFFDNELFYRFREACDRARIKIPVVAGIMPFTSESQVKRMAFTCGATIPARLIKRLLATGEDPVSVRKAGIEFACEQLTDLSRNGVDGLHVYTMNRPEVGWAAHDALVESGYLAS